MRNTTKAGVAGLLTLALIGGTTAAFASVDRHSKDSKNQTTSVDRSVGQSKDVYSGPELKSFDPASPDARSFDAHSKDAGSRDHHSKDMPSRDRISPDRISKDVLSKDVPNR